MAVLGQRKLDRRAQLFLWVRFLCCSMLATWSVKTHQRVNHCLISLSLSLSLSLSFFLSLSLSLSLSAQFHVSGCPSLTAECLYSFALEEQNRWVPHREHVLVVQVSHGSRSSRLPLVKHWLGITCWWTCNSHLSLLKNCSVLCECGVNFTRTYL